METSVRKLLTVKELAALFQKHENTIYRWLIED
jgi:transposase